MSILYNTAVYLYVLIVRLASLFHSKARKWVGGRRGWAGTLRREIPQGRPVAWFHCASLGEFEQGRPLIEAYRKQYAGHFILVTFFSPSGYEVRKNYGHADFVCYLPADTPGNARRFIDVVRPAVVFLVKYEFWHNYLSEVRKHEVPVYCVSGIFRPQQRFFRWYGGFFRKTLGCITHFFVQDEASAALLRSIGLTNVTVTGDTRFDRVHAIAAAAEAIEAAEWFCGNGRPVLIAGSTWPAEERLLGRLINEDRHGLKYIVVPHEISEDRMARFAAGLNRKTVLLSQATAGTAAAADVMVVDRMGVLAPLYRYGNIALVGGGFGRGIHNILEPVAAGLPVIFGPNHRKFREAGELLGNGGGFAIGSYSDLQDTIAFLLSDVHILKMAAELCRIYIGRNRGATEIIMEKISAS